MKKVILLLLTLITLTGYSSAQIGILALKRSDEAYYGQWYSMKKLPNAYFMINTPDEAEEVIEGILKPYDQSFEDALTDNSGDTYWTFVSGIDIKTNLYMIEESDDQIMILIVNKPIYQKSEEFEGSSYWYDRFKKRTH